MEPEAERRESGARWVWWLAAAVIAAIVLIRFAPDLRRPFLPRPVAAWVAVLPEGEQVARNGSFELAAGRRFRLFAVLEARTVTGRPIWYTEAPALALDGRDVPAGDLAPWPPQDFARVRWFTVEGSTPWLEVDSDAALERLRFRENYHPEWGTLWSADGEVDPRLPILTPDRGLRPLGFGVQRFAVRIELYRNAGALTPEARFSSPGADLVMTSPQRVTTVFAGLPAPLGQVSRAFGEPELELARGLDAATAGRARALLDAGLAVTGDRLLARHLDESGRDATKLEFRTVELGPQGPEWGSAAAPGDLLRAGDRVVVLYRDVGVPGRLDPADLAFDFDRGLRIERLDQLFRGDGGLRLDLAPVAPRPVAGTMAPGALAH
jgi:hypothetical protein